MEKDCTKLFEHFEQTRGFFSNDMLIVINKSTAYVSSNYLNDSVEKMSVKQLIDKLSILAVKEGIDHAFFSKGDWLNDPISGNYEDIVNGTKQDIYVEPIYLNLLFLTAAMANNNFKKDNVYSVISFSYEGDGIVYEECVGDEALEETITKWFKE